MNEIEPLKLKFPPAKTGLAMSRRLISRWQRLGILHTRWGMNKRRHAVLFAAKMHRDYEAGRHDWTLAQVCTRCGEPEWIDCPVNFCPTPGNRIIAEMKREENDDPRCSRCGKPAVAFLSVVAFTWDDPNAKPFCQSCYDAEISKYLQQAESNGGTLE